MIFLIPSRDVTNQTLPARESLVIGYSDIRAFFLDRKITNLFYSVMCSSSCNAGVASPALSSTNAKASGCI
jgi:hypothetical protein